MLFVITNDVVYKPMTVFCPACHVQLGKGHVKDLDNGVVYHSVSCMAYHRIVTQEAIEHHAQ